MSHAVHFICSLALAGCARGSSVSTVTTTSAGRVAIVGIHAALGDITQATCAHARACGAPADDCKDVLPSATRADLLSRDCDGVESTRLAACVDAIRHEPCATERSTEPAPAVCQRVWLCR